MDSPEAGDKMFDDQASSSSSFMEMLRKAGPLSPDHDLTSSIVSSSPVQGDGGGSAVAAQQQQQQQPAKSKGRPPPSPFNRPEESDGEGDDDHGNHADFIADHSNLEIPSSLLFEARASSSPLPSPANGQKKRKKRKHSRKSKEESLPPGLDTSTEPSMEPSTALRLPVMQERTGRSPGGGSSGGIDIDVLIASTRKAVEIDGVDGSSSNGGGSYSLVPDVDPTSKLGVSFSLSKKARGGDKAKEDADRSPSPEDSERRARSSKAKEHWHAGSKAANLMNQVLDTFTVGDSDDEEKSPQLQLRELEVRPTDSTLQKGMKMRRESDVASPSPPTVGSDQGVDGTSSSSARTTTRSAGGRMLDFVTKRVGRRSRGWSGDSGDNMGDEGSHDGSGNPRFTRRMTLSFNAKVEEARRKTRNSIHKLKHGDKRLSVLDVLGQAKAKEEQEEIQASVGQFRNPIFDNSIARASGERSERRGLGARRSKATKRCEYCGV